jgi:hypothetical protein
MRTKFAPLFPARAYKKEGATLPGLRSCWQESWLELQGADSSKSS